MSLIKRFSDHKIDLLSANFDFVGFKEIEELGMEEIKEAKRKIEDSYEIRAFSTALEENKMDITFTRKIYFEPNILYNISVSLNISYPIEKENNKPITKKALEKELEKHTERILRPVIGRASLLISNITNADDDLLIITPPNLKK